MDIKFCELAQKAIKNGDENEMWELADNFVDRVERVDSRLYDEFISKLERIAYRISEKEAEKIVKEMTPKGQVWSYSEVEKMIADKGIRDKSEIVEYYLCMNMAYNDYYGTAKKFGLSNDPEFYFCIAKDFIDDPDAKPFKVQKYFLNA